MDRFRRFLCIIMVYIFVFNVLDKAELKTFLAQGFPDFFE